MDKDQKRNLAISYLKEHLKDFECLIKEEDYGNAIVIIIENSRRITLASRDWKETSKLDKAIELIKSNT